MLKTCRRDQSPDLRPSPRRRGDRWITHPLRAALPLLALVLLTAGCGESTTAPGGKFISLSEIFTEDEAIVIEDGSETTVRMVGVHFQTNSATPTAESLDILAKFKQVFNNGVAAQYSVEAHTDSRGSNAYNKTLTNRRAQNVRDYFINELGGPADAITAVGWGEDEPIATNNTAEGRAANRRLEIIIKPVD